MNDIINKIYFWCLLLGAVATAITTFLSVRKIKNAAEGSDHAAPSEKPDEHIYAPLSPKALSINGICAFVMIFGLGGMCVSSAGLNTAASLAIAVCLGISAEVTASILMYAVRLRSDKTELFVPNAIGTPGVVCADIPASQSGRGRIRIFKNNRIYELEALSVDEVTLTKGTKIRIMLADSDTVAVVERDAESGAK